MWPLWAPQREIQCMFYSLLSSISGQQHLQAICHQDHALLYHQRCGANWRLTGTSTSGQAGANLKMNLSEINHNKWCTMTMFFNNSPLDECLC